MDIRCAKCHCLPQHCTKVAEDATCSVCSKDTCCCLTIHKSASKTRFPGTLQGDDCCLNNTCSADKEAPEGVSSYGVRDFFANVKRFYAAALGIEILCIAAAEIGENSGLYIFGFNHTGIPIAYAMGYALAGFTTFAAILGRYRYNEKIDSCCSILEQNSEKGFIVSLVATLKDFVVGLGKMATLHRQKELKRILKTSGTILVTAESACILTAETVDLVFYNVSIFLSIPIALFVGAFAVVVIEAYKKRKTMA